MITKLDFVAVPSRDIERARAFYVETLGLRPDPQARYEFWVGETCFGIWDPDTMGGSFAPQKNGHIAFHVDDVAAARSELEAKGVTFLLPMDHVIAQKVAADSEIRIVDSTAIPAGWMGLDIGPKARAAFATAIRGAKTVVWNGPMGVFELPPFREGTFSVARAIAESGATSIVGGGDSVAAVTQAGLADRMSHISTGGGASLEFLEGIELPGVAALMDRK